MERFLSPLRGALPDIDIDVESARREEIYRAILDRYGGERCVCVSMMDTYRVRHAVRMSVPRSACHLARSTRSPRRFRTSAPAMLAPHCALPVGWPDFNSERLNLMFRLVESLDGLPRHIAVVRRPPLRRHPARPHPVEASYAGFPDEPVQDDVEDLAACSNSMCWASRMQSSMAYAIKEIARTDEVEVDLDAGAPTTTRRPSR